MGVNSSIEGSNPSFSALASRGWRGRGAERATLSVARRGGRAVECGGLENRYGSLGSSRVQIPPSPLRRTEPRLVRRVSVLRRRRARGRQAFGVSVSRRAKDRGSALELRLTRSFETLRGGLRLPTSLSLMTSSSSSEPRRPIPRSSEVARSTHTGGWREAAAVVQDGAIGSWPRAAGQRAQTRRELDPCGGSHLPRSARRASARADALRAKTPKVSLRSGWTRKAL